MRLFLLITTTLLMLANSSVKAERNCLPEGATFPDAWFTNYTPHRIVGNLYAVGGVDLAVYLITTPDGHILVNTGMGDSTAQIKANMEMLGFDLTDVKILLVQQSHFDHSAALAEIKQLTGAKLFATIPDTPILELGGANDPHFGECLDFRFPAVKVDRQLKTKEVIEFGGMKITTHIHAGHTEGSSSYSFQHIENGRTYEVLIANMGSINQGKNLLVDATYEGVAEDFAHTYASQLGLPVDIWVAAHASQYKRDDKYTPGQRYDPEIFVDPEGFKEAVAKLQEAFHKQLYAEQKKVK